MRIADLKPPFIRYFSLIISLPHCVRWILPNNTTVSMSASGRPKPRYWNAKSPNFSGLQFLLWNSRLILFVGFSSVISDIDYEYILHISLCTDICPESLWNNFLPFIILPVHRHLTVQKEEESGKFYTWFHKQVVVKIRQSKKCVKQISVYLYQIL